MTHTMTEYRHEFAAATTTAQRVEINGNRAGRRGARPRGRAGAHHPPRRARPRARAPSRGPASAGSPTATAWSCSTPAAPARARATSRSPTSSGRPTSTGCASGSAPSRSSWPAAPTAGSSSMEYAIRYPDRVRAMVLRDTAATTATRSWPARTPWPPTGCEVDMEKFDRIDDGPGPRRRRPARLLARDPARSTTSTTTPPWSSARSRRRPTGTRRTTTPSPTTCPNYDLKRQLRGDHRADADHRRAHRLDHPGRVQRDDRRTHPGLGAGGVREVRSLAADRGGGGVDGDRAGSSSPRSYPASA